MGKVDKRITILDVASKSGVSKSTVSRVLRGDDDVSEAVRVKVTHAAEQLGYQPSVFAGVLRSRRSYAICLVIPDIANPFFPEIARSVQRVAEEHGYSVLMTNSDWLEERERKNLELVRRYHLDGVIINPVHIDAEELARLGCPVVVIGSRPEYAAFDCVGSDTLGSIRQALDHLTERGHTAIGLIPGPADRPATATRVDAFRAEMARRNLLVPPGRIVYAEFTHDGGAAAAGALLAPGVRPTAILCGNDVIALGALAALQVAGVAVPDDISVVGIDNIDSAGVTCPPLTTIGKNKSKLGERATELLIARIEGRLGPVRVRELLPTTLIARGSVAPPRRC